MVTTSVVKVVAAFVAGLIVALGSALIYVRASDAQRTEPTLLTASGRKEPPDAEVREAVPPAQAAATPQPISVDPTPRRKIVRRPRTYTDPLLVRVPRVIPIKTQSASPAAKPVLLAQAKPAVPAVVAPQQTAPPQDQPGPELKTFEPEPDPHDGLYTAQPSTQPASAPITPTPQPHIVTLPVGTVLQIRLGETLSTDDNYTGDTFRGALMSPVIQDGFIIADSGSKVLGTILNVQSAGHLASVAELSLALAEINTTDGQRVHVITDGYDARGKSNVGSDAAKIAGGAALGAIIGGLAGGGKGAAIGAGAGGAAGTGVVLMTHGPAAVVQSETVLSFRLVKPVKIIEKLN